ncbi:kinase-associated protein phosphatase 1-like protein, partial [Dinothrombium tinctorium]
ILELPLDRMLFQSKPIRVSLLEHPFTFWSEDSFGCLNVKILQLIGDKQTQEDGFFNFFYNNYFIVGICDGHNGSNCVDYICQNFERLYINNSSKFKSMSEIFRHIFIQLDTIFIENEFYDGVVVSIFVYHTKSKLSYVAQLGDTTVLLFDSNFFEIFHSEKHDTKNPNEIVRFTNNSQVLNLPYSKDFGLMPTRVLGSTHIKQPSLKRELDPLCPIPQVNTISNASFALLATDGITDLINCAEISKIVQNERCIIKSVEIIFEHCKKFTVFKDNQTLIGVNLLKYE